MIQVDELQRLNRQLAARHDQRVLMLASMYQFMFTVSQIHGPMPHQVNTALLAQCVHARLSEIDASDLDFERALTDLHRAQHTLQLLTSLPDDVDETDARAGWLALRGWRF